MTRRQLEYEARAELSVLLEVVDCRKCKELAVEVWKLVAVATKERKEEEPLALVPCWDPFGPKLSSHQPPRRDGCWSFVGQMESQNAEESVRQLTSLCDDQFVTLFPHGSFVLLCRLVGLTPSSGCPRTLVYGQEVCLSA